MYVRLQKVGARGAQGAVWLGNPALLSQTASCAPLSPSHRVWHNLGLPGCAEKLWLAPLFSLFARLISGTNSSAARV